MVVSPSADRLWSHAQQLLRAGRSSEAIAVHRQLLVADPSRADGWYNLGYLLQQTGALEEALHAYARAVQEGMDGPEEALCNRALILAQYLRRPDEAQAEFEAALRRNPRYVPALVNLGTLHEQQGHRAAALASYQAALALEPNHSLALSRLPNVATIQVPSDPLVLRLRAALGRPGLSDADRADLGFALGKALDGCRAYDAAFEAYTAANEASRRSAGPGRGRYDRQAAEGFVDALLSAFPESVPEAAPAADVPPELIFVCGMFRSGSTLVEKILASHSQITAGGELELLPALLRAVLGQVLGGRLALDQGQAQRMAEQYLSEVRRRFPQAVWLTDKRPDNFLAIGLIKRLFPRARIVYTRREPLDNCLALYFLHLAHTMPYALDLRDAAHWYRQHERLMAHWRRLYGGDIVEVDYDSLVRDPGNEVRALLHGLQMPWDERCLAFHETDALVQTPSNWQVRQPLYTTSSGRWRHYERHLHALKATLRGAA